jgi:hypothetical protein
VSAYASTRRQALPRFHRAVAEGGLVRVTADNGINEYRFNATFRDSGANLRRAIDLCRSTALNPSVVIVSGHHAARDNTPVAPCSADKTAMSTVAASEGEGWWILPRSAAWAGGSGMNADTVHRRSPITLIYHQRSARTQPKTLSLKARR